MRRIGVAASKMAQGNLFAYNAFVVGISTLIATLVFLVSGLSIMLALFLISLVLRLVLHTDFSLYCIHILKLSLIALGVVIGLLNAVAIFKNMILHKSKL